MPPTRSYEKLPHLNQKRNHINNERDIDSEVQIVTGGHRRMDIQGIENRIWHNVSADLLSRPRQRKASTAINRDFRLPRTLERYGSYRRTAE